MIALHICKVKTGWYADGGGGSVRGSNYFKIMQFFTRNWVNIPNFGLYIRIFLWIPEMCTSSFKTLHKACKKRAIHYLSTLFAFSFLSPSVDPVMSHQLLLKHKPEKFMECNLSPMLLKELLFLHKYLYTQLFEVIVKSTKAIFKQLKPCSNHGIHMLFEHGFYMKIFKTGQGLCGKKFYGLCCCWRQCC